MRAGAPYQRVAAFPASGVALQLALATFDQRVGDKFDAMDRNGGDVVGKWRSLPGIGLDTGAIGNGRILGQWRRVGLDNAAMRVFIEWGSTSALGPFGTFRVKAPEGFAFDSQPIVSNTDGNTYAPAVIAGLIGGVLTGAVAIASIQPGATDALVLGAAFGSVAVGDKFNVSFELPIKVSQ